MLALLVSVDLSADDSSSTVAIVQDALVASGSGGVSPATSMSTN